MQASHWCEGAGWSRKEEDQRGFKYSLKLVGVRVLAQVRLAFSEAPFRVGLNTEEWILLMGRTMSKCKVRPEEKGGEVRFGTKWDIEDLQPRIYESFVREVHGKIEIKRNETEGSGGYNRRKTNYKARM